MLQDQLPAHRLSKQLQGEGPLAEGIVLQCHTVLHISCPFWILVGQKQVMQRPDSLDVEGLARLRVTVKEHVQSQPPGLGPTPVPVRANAAPAPSKSFDLQPCRLRGLR